MEYYTCLQVKARWHVKPGEHREGGQSSCLVFSFASSSFKHVVFIWFHLSMNHSFSFSHHVSFFSPPLHICHSQIKMAFCRLSEHTVGLIGSYYTASVSHQYAILMQMGTMGVMRGRETGIGKEDRKKRICPLNTMNHLFKFLHTVWAFLSRFLCALLRGSWIMWWSQYSVCIIKCKEKLAE